MYRTIGLAAGLVLAISTALIALSGGTAAASTGTAQGHVTVTIMAPSGVAANVKLAGPQTAVFAKPARGTRKQVSLGLPAGRYRVEPEEVVFKGSLYGSASHQIVTLRGGHAVSIAVRFGTVASASSLHPTRISATSISLAWRAPGGAGFALRRTAGSQAATSRRAGTGVHVTGHTAVATGLQPGRHYSFALFTRMRGRWAGPITLLAGTAAPAGAATASFAAVPGTLLGTPSDILAATATGSGVQVTLSPTITAPVIGAAVVLPESASLPGGFIGTVSRISSDGSALTLRPASLSNAFEYYSINIPSFASKGKATALTLGSRGLRPGSACSGSAAGTITFTPSIRVGGSFHVTINTGSLDIPTGASFAIKLTASVSGAMSADTTASLACAISFGQVFQTLTEDPVPISVLFSPGASVSITGELDESDIGATVTGGVKLSGSLGLSSGAHFSGSDVLMAVPLTPQVSVTGSIGLTLGGDIVLGPGAGDSGAGAIAGLSGELDPVVATFTPVPRLRCTDVSVQGKAMLGLTARAWLGPWNIGATVTVPALHRTVSYPGSPWLLPASLC